MSGRVLLDLNLPKFQDDLLALDTDDLRRVFKALRKLRGMHWDDVHKDHGLHWEAVKGTTARYTIRLSLRYRAVVRREGDFIRFMALHADHDGVYGKRP